MQSRARAIHRNSIYLSSCRIHSTSSEISVTFFSYVFVYHGELTKSKEKPSEVKEKFSSVKDNFCNIHLTRKIYFFSLQARKESKILKVIFLKHLQMHTRHEIAQFQAGDNF